MRYPLGLRLAAIFLLATATAIGAEEAPRRAAFFGLIFVNTSAEATTEEETRRLAEMGESLVAGMEGSGRYVFVDTAPVEEKASRYASLAHCNGCDSRLAAELGADLSVTGEVQKTSNLILSVSIFIRDAATGALVGGGSADMRGNTDESWARAVSYILRNRILRE